MRAVAFLGLALLGGCGGGGGGGIPHARGIPANFGDSAPHAWTASSRPDRYAVHGVDVSRYQGAIDWSRAADAGVAFAFVKATEGGDRVDPAFAENAARARAAGVAVGPYHFYYFCTPPEQQAAWFIANAPASAGNLPPVLDVEWNRTSPTCHRHPDPATARAEIETFANIVARHYGQTPIIYTTPDFYRDANLGSLGAEQFWLRSVSGRPEDTYRGERWTFWQYTGTGAVPGVSGEVDLSAFHGSKAEWQAWLAAHRRS